MSEPSHSMTSSSETVSFNSRAVLLSLFALVIFILVVYFFSVMSTKSTGVLQSLSTVFIAAISGSLALGGTLISQLWGKDDTTSPPRIINMQPSDEEANVPVGTPIWASFDRQMNESSLNPETFTLKDEKSQTNLSEVTVKLEGGNAYLEHPSLAEDTRYIVTITKDVRDVAGHPLAKDVTWSFKTAKAT